MTQYLVANYASGVRSDTQKSLYEWRQFIYYRMGISLYQRDK